MPVNFDHRDVARQRIAFLHGFTQTHHHWHDVAERVADQLPRRPTLVLPDLPGHGLSGADRLDIEAAAAELADHIGPATYVGYSMGGRVALHVALAPNTPVERLVLIGGTAGIADPAERAGRRHLDDERAARIGEIGIDAFLAEWLAAPLFATLPPDRSGLELRRRNTADGLAHSLRTGGTGVQRSLWGDLGTAAMPVLLIVGELDTKFTSIAHQMAEQLPDAEVSIVAGAGHAAHTERPDEVATTIAGWMLRQG